MSDPDDVDQRLRALAGALDEMESSVARSPAALMTSIVKRVSKRRLLSAAMSVGVTVALVPIALMTVGVLTSSLRDSNPSVRPSGIESDVGPANPGQRRLVTHNREDVSMVSLLTGMLRWEGDCLIVQSGASRPVLPIWPPGFTLSDTGGATNVVDADGNTAAVVGEETTLTGGDVSPERANLSPNSEIGEACTGFKLFSVAAPR